MNIENVAVISFSGNVGKTLVSSYLLTPRIDGARYVSVESINSDENMQDVTVTARKFDSIYEALLMREHPLVIDIGASNVEEFLKRMVQSRGSHQDIDYYIIPTVKEAKQVRDTINTIGALIKIGVKANQIKVVFNKVEAHDNVQDDFLPLFELAKDKQFSGILISEDCAIEMNDVFQLLRNSDINLNDLIQDNTDYRAQLRTTKDQNEREQLVFKIQMKGLSISADENLNQVFSRLFPAQKAKKETQVSA
jgi:hypothetical protein